MPSGELNLHLDSEPMFVDNQQKQATFEFEPRLEGTNRKTEVTSPDFDADKSNGFLTVDSLWKVLALSG